MTRLWPAFVLVLLLLVLGAAAAYGTGRLRREAATLRRRLAEQEEREAILFDRSQRLFAPDVLAPTRLGNDAAALRSYCKTGRPGADDCDFFSGPHIRRLGFDPALIKRMFDD